MKSVGSSIAIPSIGLWIRCGDSELTVHKWSAEIANAAGARHYCGEAHAEVYISRWFASACTPSKPDYNRAS